MLGQRMIFVGSKRLGFPDMTFGLWVRDLEGIGLRIRRPGVRNVGLSIRCVSGIWV